ncbi:MAG: BLUF domain-containing protein [Nitrospinae bacterium]|nr:BLUF domain-containing protein [Nitrospinota bacterium]
MHTLFYSSVASREMLDSDILDILKVSREKNSQHHITGILVYQKKSREFFQILEGEKEAIFRLLENIKNDERNLSLDLVYDEEIPERNFKDWGMAFADLDSVTNNKLDGFSEYLEKGFTSELSQENKNISNRIIKMFQHYLSDFSPT